MTRNFLKVFSAFLLLTGSLAHGAAFQFGGLRLDAVKVTSGATTTTLTKSDNQIRVIAGTATDTQKLPDATTLQAGYWYMFINESTNTLTVQNSSALTLVSLTSGQSAQLVVTSTSTSGGPWSIFSGAASGAGGGACVAPVITKTADYVIQASDFTCANKVLNVEANCTSACTMTLPAASNSGFEVRVIDLGTTQATVSTAGSDTFGTTSDSTWILSPGGSPQASNLFWANGGSRWNGF